MAREEVSEEVEESTEETDKKYFSAQFSKSEDAEFIARVGRIQRIGGISLREVFEAGVNTVVKSNKYQDAVRAIANDAE